MNINLLEIAIQSIYAIIFLLALRDYVRRRDTPRLEIATLFGVLAIALDLPLVLEILNVELSFSEHVTALLLVTQPYLFLRLVGHFRKIPTYQHVLAVSMLVVSWALVLTSGSALSTGGTLILVGLFLYVESYATIALIQVVRTALGVVRLRATAIICGSACLALVLFFVGIAEVVPSTEAALTDLVVVLLLASGIAYYLGFTSPRWFRNVVQRAEIWRFLDLIAKHPAETRLTTALDNVAPAAARAVGAKSALVAIGTRDRDQLRIHLDPESRAYGALADDPLVQLGETADPLTRAWRELHPVLVEPREMSIQPLARIAHAVGGSQAALAVPLVAHGETHGLLIVFFDHRSIFLDDDLAVLAMLADHAAAEIENNHLYRTARQAATSQEMLLQLSQLLADELEATAVAKQLARQVSKVLPSEAWGVLLPTSDGGLEIIATGGVDAEARGGRRFPPGAGISGQAFQSGRAVLVDDVRQAPEYLGLPSDVRSELAVPLRHRGESLGVVNFERNEVAGFDEAEVAMAEIVASIAAQAVARARLLEQLHLQNLALDAASRHKSEFLATMSHELRTPLNAIIGFSELLLEEQGDDYDQVTSVQFLSTIHSSGRHLLSLINDILDLSKVEAGHMELVPEECDIATLVAQTLSTLKPLATRAAIDLEMDVDEMPPFVADPGKLKQVLYNLLSNAIKFTPEGGVVTVHARADDDGLVLTVADNGIGISQENQERIFQEFQQIDMGPGRHFEGTGLGLTLTRRFVELHEGRIWVESVLGAGSQFHVFLPARELDVAMAPEFELPPDIVPRREGDADNPLVLIVEDDPRAANLLTLYLSRGGYRSTITGDGDQALEQARELQPAAITLDVLLPSLDGWEVLRALKRDATTRDIPVIIASIVDNADLGYALGANDYFVKPVDRVALLDCIGRLALPKPATNRAVDVLIVDDEPDSIELLARMLDRPGFNILRKTSGVAGIEAALEAEPDLILLDLMMPDVNGFDVVDALRAVPATRETPIIIVTAKELTPEDKARLNGRVTALLQKGAFAAVELVAWLNQTLNLPQSLRKEEALDTSDYSRDGVDRRGSTDQHVTRADSAATGGAPRA